MTTRSRWLAVLAGVVTTGCSSSPRSTAPATAAPESPPASRSELIERLRTRGNVVTEIDATHTLVCSDPDSASCVCLAELDCGAGECVTLGKNLQVFKAAERVSCEIADTGRLCDGFYFRFEGDIYRWETRFFDAKGTLIGQRNGTDYPQFCDGKATIQFAGAVPSCATPATDVTVLCGDADSAKPMPNPLAWLGFGLVREAR